MVAKAEIEAPRSQIDPDTFPTRRLKDAYAGITAGRVEASHQLTEIIWDGYCPPGSLRYYGDVVYTEEKIRAIELLPLVGSSQALPVAQRILENGLRGHTLQRIVCVTAEALSRINDPQVGELAPLVRQNLAKINGRDGELLDDDESAFMINRDQVVQSLQEAHTTILWHTGGKVRESLRFILPLTRKGESFLILSANPEARSIICWDLEGPLSGMDCAYEVFKLITQGKEMFEAISHYDDMVCGLIPGRREWRREGYEAGDTLKLIVPQLVHHGVGEDDIRRVSSRATLVPGVKELFGQLRSEGWTLQIVSTSYVQHAHNIGGQLGVTEQNIYCTRLPLNLLRQSYSNDAAVLIRDLEKRLASFKPEDFGTDKDSELKVLLDKFYWQDLPRTKLGQAIKSIIVMGGARKVWAIERVARKLDAFIEQMAFVGDSITDSQAAKVVEAMRGLMVAFNGNNFVIPFATAGLATLDMRNLKPMLDVWLGNGRMGLQEWLSSQPEPQDEFGPHQHWLAGADEETLEQVITIHGKLRRKIREDAASLG